MILSRIGGDDAAEEACDENSGDLFRARLNQIINLKHELAQFGEKATGIGSTARSRR